MNAYVCTNGNKVKYASIHNNEREAIRVSGRHKAEDRWTECKTIAEIRRVCRGWYRTEQFCNYARKWGIR